MVYTLDSRRAAQENGTKERYGMNMLIKERTLSEKAYDALCSLIQQMEPGNNRLPSEDDLARLMGVSRATVREALKHLMIDGVTTTIHGKGTYAHPSVFQVQNRMDICSDFMMMLSRQYDKVEVEPEWIGYSEPSGLYRRCFGPERGRPYSTGWLYRADGMPRLYGIYEICPEYLSREPNENEQIISLPQFSVRNMKSPIDYCSMTARMGENETALKRLQLEKPQTLLYWEEKIYDVEDHLVAVGEVYIHPTNMELSVVTRFEL